MDLYFQCTTFYEAFFGIKLLIYVWIMCPIMCQHFFLVNHYRVYTMHLFNFDTTWILYFILGYDMSTLSPPCAFHIFQIKGVSSDGEWCPWCFASKLEVSHSFFFQHNP